MEKHPNPKAKVQCCRTIADKALQVQGKGWEGRSENCDQPAGAFPSAAGFGRTILAAVKDDSKISLDSHLKRWSME